MNSKRIAGLDILRFLSMLGIVGLHVLNAGGVLGDSASALNKGIGSILLVICYTSVNIFAMLSGYLYAGRENIRSSNLIKLLTGTLFFCAVTTGAFLVAGGIPDNTPMLTFCGFFPFAAGRYWYLVCYIFLFLMMPYINRLTSSLQKRNFRILLVILFIMLSVFDTVSPVKYFYVGDGYSPVWLIFCYLAGSYVKLYSEDFCKFSSLLCIFLSLVSSGIAFSVWFIFKEPAYFHYNSPFTVISAMLMLTGFSKINPQNKAISKIFGSLSASAFSVYVIHAHIYIMDYLLTGSLTRYISANPFICFGATFALILGIYLAGFVADTLKQLIFRITKLDNAADLLGSKLDKLLRIDKHNTIQNK